MEQEAYGAKAELKSYAYGSERCYHKKKTHWNMKQALNWQLSKKIHFF